MNNTPTTSKAWNISLWIVQVILALNFLWAAYMKLLTPTAELAKMWPWVGENPGLTKITGVIDLLAGLGIILPSLLKIKPLLTVFAARGIALLMIAATVFHVSRGEGAVIGFNIFVFGLAVFVRYGREQKAPIAEH